MKSSSRPSTHEPLPEERFMPARPIKLDSNYLQNLAIKHTKMHTNWSGSAWMTTNISAQPSTFLKNTARCNCVKPIITNLEVTMQNLYLAMDLFRYS
jgi:hypothetical protein